ncbi:hypothetical protein P7K49_010018 [Saguinus oedipus]|uniref:Uncharacterized protein n=1 Tax=Saguinus oedipus TaxID=9490 RepID=A0ABQ9VPU5_SAGOE|nr:hypothetical protein P7K49_010018 [Saguinus oedipus]
MWQNSGPTSHVPPLRAPRPCTSASPWLHGPSHSSHTEQSAGPQPVRTLWLLSRHLVGSAAGLVGGGPELSQGVHHADSAAGGWVPQEENDLTDVAAAGSVQNHLNAGLAKATWTNATSARPLAPGDQYSWTPACWAEALSKLSACQESWTISLLAGQERPGPTGVLHSSPLCQRSVQQGSPESSQDTALALLSSAPWMHPFQTGSQ